VFEVMNIARNDTGGADGLAVLISHETSGNVFGFRAAREAFDG
jgi:hypothetical protein